jgi:hypothetical protein
MGTALFVGNLPDATVIPAISDFTSKTLNVKLKPNRSFLSRLLGKESPSIEVLGLIDRWKNGPENIGYIDCLNEASTILFLEYTAKLEGLSDVNEATENSVWKNLPYWTQTIWLPLENGEMGSKLVEEATNPTLICTASGLLSDLKQIAEKSDLKLGKKPKGFDLMLSDASAFYAKKNFQLDEDSTILWVWLSLQTGAELALKNNMPLWSGG